MKKEEILHFFIIPTFIGIIGGFSAYIFRYFIKFFNSIYNEVIILSYNKIDIFIMPVLFYFSYIITSKLLKNIENITIDKIVKKISLIGGNFSILKGLLILILTSLNIGFGAPIGRESPIAKLGGLFSELFIKLTKLPRENIPIYLSAGVSSAISATFNAPIAGIFFGIEIILGRINSYILIPLIISCSIATIISRKFIGYYPAFYIPYLEYKEIYIYLVPLGAIFFSFLSYVLIYSLKKFAELQILLSHKWKLIVILNGFLVGAIISFFPQTKGVGYEFITKLFNNGYLAEYTLIISILKLIAVILTIGSGIFGGLMSPSIFIGAFGGYWFGSLFYEYNIDPRVFAFIGIGSLLAGVTKAPVRSTIIIVELTHSYQLLIPLLFSSAITSFILSKFETGAYFRRTLFQKGIDIDNPVIIEFLKNCSLKKYTKYIEPLKINSSIKYILEKFENEDMNYLPVVDDNKNLIGIISTRDLRKRWFIRKTDIRAKDLMSEKPLAVKEGSHFEDILKAIAILDVPFIPVIDKNGKYLGMLNLQKLIKDLSLEEIKC